MLPTCTALPSVFERRRKEGATNESKDYIQPFSLKNDYLNSILFYKKKCFHPLKVAGFLLFLSAIGTSVSLRLSLAFSIGYNSQNDKKGKPKTKNPILAHLFQMSKHITSVGPLLKNVLISTNVQRIQDLLWR
jgi:hypothetical protein